MRTFPGFSILNPRYYSRSGHRNKIIRLISNIKRNELSSWALLRFIEKAEAGRMFSTGDQAQREGSSISTAINTDGAWRW